jgi:hypothetical protein
MQNARNPRWRPDLHLPDLHLPDLHLPDLHLPDLHLPDLHLPDLHLEEAVSRSCPPNDIHSITIYHAAR